MAKTGSNIGNSKSDSVYKISERFIEVISN